MRSSSSTLIDQYTTDCQSIGEALHANVQQLTDDAQTMLSTCHRSVGKQSSRTESFRDSFFIARFFRSGQVLTISSNIASQMYVLNEKVRTVLSLAFQNFHTVFEEINSVHNHFQVGQRAIPTECIR